MLKKIFFSALVLTTILSCNPDGPSITEQEVPPVNYGVAMITDIDGVTYNTPPQIGGNASDASGGIYGSNYFLLYGYKNVGTGKAKVGNKVFEMRIAVPKGNLSLGDHFFGADITAGEYYADLDISGVTPPENVKTNSGSVTVNSYDSANKLMKGTFSFTTNNGVDLTTTTHTVSGNFTYFLQ
jgi:hypothetical protein